MANGDAQAQNIHASGQPDTPVEVITALLQSALASDNVADVKSQLQKAYDVVSGLDSYLESVSTSPSTVGHAVTISFLCKSARSWKTSIQSSLQVCQDLIQLSMKHDWDKVYDQVRMAVDGPVLPMFARAR